MYSTGDQDAEPGARLTCHLLLRLFQTVSLQPGSVQDSSKNNLYIKSTCDRHLLEASHSNIPVGAVLAILKAMLVLGNYSQYVIGYLSRINQWNDLQWYSGEVKHEIAFLLEVQDQLCYWLQLWSPPVCGHKPFGCRFKPWLILKALINFTLFPRCLRMLNWFY